MISSRVRTILLVLLLGCFFGAQPVFGQEKVVQTFLGIAPLTTTSFTVQDKWEVRWECTDVVSVTLLSPDGTVLAGVASSAKGSFYQPKGGTYALKISRVNGAPTTQWRVLVVEVGAGMLAPDDKTAMNYVPSSVAVISDPSAAAPATVASASPAATTNAPPAAVASASPAATTNVPPAAAATNATPGPAGVEGLTSDQARAVVVIKGDVGEGTGFLVKTASGPAVVTNNHVIRANPNIHILTTTGAEIKTLGLKGASDRDLVMFQIKDDHYTYFDLATDLKDTVAPGDTVITPGNSEGGEVVLDTKGAVVGIGPQQIEFSNPIYHGNSGGPVFHVKSNKVLAVVTMAMKVDTSDALDKASFENKNSAIAGAMRYFGLRIDNVPEWQTYDWNRFLNETTFLKTFHDQSRCLDSFMNGEEYEKENISGSDENSPPDSKYYLQNDKIATAHDNFHKLSTDADASERIDAGRELLMSLEGVANQDMDAIQTPSNFYSFDQTLADDEVKYRKALTKEIEEYGNKISDMGH
jgi:hypothetical protein